ncbi:alpha/beta hydrolase [bacterium 210820-DFI.6.37]|nr:alpha/beta hydrolase [bacterium 210820-DFI.6.37]
MNIKVNGTELFYKKEGSGPPLILLHGNGEDHHIFDSAALELAGQWTVYRPDSRGHGRSQPVERFHYQEMAEDVIGFIEKLRLEKPILYGFSDGGILALLIASQRRELLRGIIISGANLQPKGMKRRWYFLFALLYVFNRDAKFYMMLTEPNITAEQLRQIKIPAYVTAGQKDVIKEKHTRFLAKQIPRSRVEILPGETHSSYVERGAALAAVIRRGLAFIEAPRKPVNPPPDEIPR